MAVLSPEWHALSLGGLPYVSAEIAWDSILRHTGVIPAWPQLPNRSPNEGMYAQFAERFPGIDLNDGNLRVGAGPELERDLERLYLAYLENDLAYGAVSPAYAAGLALLQQGKVALPEKAVALKGQVTGPISWGLSVIDAHQQPILNDRVLGDAVSKHICLKAAWQEQQLSRRHPRTIIFIDEPYLASLGSAFVRLSQDQASSMLEEVLSAIRGWKGIHCCGDTDWSLVLRLSVNIISFDAYDYAPRLAAHGREVAIFLERGGVLAWGIVPAGVASRSETVETLVQRLEDGIAALVSAGVPREAIERAGLVSPSCSLGRLEPAVAERVLQLTEAVSQTMRERLGYETASDDSSSV
ncbi:MAG: methionine synthase [Anaerolineae bacterium]|jgi:hypothetical protein